MSVNFRIFVSSVTFLLICGGGSFAQDIPSEVLAYPQLILHNGKILTADQEFRIVQAVGIRDNQFLKVGSNQEVLRLAGPDTKIMDLEGKTVIPGFINSHSHGWLGQTLKRGPDGMVTFPTLEEGLAQIKAIVEKAPAGKYVQVLGIRNTVAMEVAGQKLDPVSPHNPLAISFSTFEYNLNSLAFKQALRVMGPDVPGLVKDPETGEYTGQLRGMASGTFGYEVLPFPDIESLVPQEKVRMSRYLRQGVTTNIGRAPAASLSILRELWIRKELPTRVRITHEFLRDNHQPERFLKRFGNLTGFGDDWMKIIGTLVQQPDGSATPGGMLSSRPKLRSAPQDYAGPYGQNRWEQYNNAAESIRLAAQYGWKLASIHSYGDESSRLLLKAFDEANQTKSLEGRWIIDHNYIHNEETIALMKKLNVIPSVLLWWGNDGGFRTASMGDRNLNPASRGGELGGGFAGTIQQSPIVFMYGGDRASGYSPLRSLVDAGLKPVLENGGSRWTPLQDIRQATTRKDINGRVWGAEQAMTRQEALWAKTSWAARISEDEDKLGTIEEGKLADLVVLGRDYLTVPLDEIGEIPVLMTILDGRVVYEQ